MTTLTAHALERARRELTASIALPQSVSAARKPILARLIAIAIAIDIDIDIELTRLTGQRPYRPPGSQRA